MKQQLTMFDVDQYVVDDHPDRIEVMYAVYRVRGDGEKVYFLSGHDNRPAGWILASTRRQPKLYKTLAGARKVAAFYHAEVEIYSQ